VNRSRHRVISSEIETFLRRLGLPDEQYLEIRSVIPDRGGVRQRFRSSIDEAISSAQEAGRSANVYVGACPRSIRKGSRGAIRLVTATWADLDFHDINPHDRQSSENEALSRIGRFRFPPTMLIHSGNGLQAWWLYREPMRLSRTHTAEHFEAINRGIGKALGGDAVHDLARVLRLPGTLNIPDARKRARGCVPVMARIVDVNGPSYSPDDLCELRAETRPAAVPTRRTLDAIPFESDAEVIATFLRLLDALDSKHRLVRTWRGDRVLGDSSRSGWDMALANQLVRAGIRSEFLADILRAYPLGRGRAATSDYLVRTITKARSSAGERL